MYYDRDAQMRDATHGNSAYETKSHFIVTNKSHHIPFCRDPRDYQVPPPRQYRFEQRYIDDDAFSTFVRFS